MAFAYKRRITIDHTKVSATLTDFPVWVSVTSNDLRTVANGGHVQHSSGYDIYLYADEELTTPITSWERVHYDASTGSLKLHVKVSSLSSSSDTVLWMAYGDASISTQQWMTDTTWTSVAVYHMDHDPSGTAPQITDVTGNGNNGTSGGSMTSGDLVSGPLGSAIDFDGTNDHIALASTSGMPVYTRTGTYSISTWVKGASGQSGRMLIGIGSNVDGNALVSMGTPPAGGSKMSVFVRGNSNPVNHRTTTVDVFNSNWHHVVLTDDAGSMKVYVDGVQDATNFAHTPPATISTNLTTLGALGRTAISNWIAAQMGETRFYGTELSAAWISTEYANQNDVASFLTLGSQVSVSPARRRRIWRVI